MKRYYSLLVLAVVVATSGIGFSKNIANFQNPEDSVRTKNVVNKSSSDKYSVFTNVVVVGLTDVASDSWNGAWVDYDGDGFEDIYLTDKSGVNGNKLFKNDGEGRFVQIKNHALVNFKAESSSCSFADINNDGKIDAFVTNVLGKSMLFLNTGNGNFAEITNSGIDDQAEYFHGCTWFDYDNDGFVDLLITNYFETHFHQLYHNNGDNTFTRIYNTPLTLEGRRSMAPTCADYNNDGLVDVFIPNGNNTENSLFKNIGNGQFVKVTDAGAIVTDLNNSVGAAWGDYNNDGWMDLFVANASNQDNCLYRNNKNGTFTKITNSIVTQDGGQSHCGSWIDYDNDGDIDLYVTNDYGDKFFYVNDGLGNFTKTTINPITQDYGLTFGHVWADYNKDGSQDLLVFTHSNQPNWLFKGSAQNNKWISIKLIGTNSNKSAVGTTVKVKANGTWQMRQVNTQSGFGSQNSLVQHFGLTNAGKIDSIIIKWPSGYNQYITKAKPGSNITVIEDASPLITGYAFNDKNSNGVKDAGELGISNTKFTISPANLLVSTDESGYYEIRLPKGTYTFNFSSSNQYWRYPSVKTLTVGSNPSTTYTLNVPLVAKQTGYDLSANYSTTAWRRGFKNQSSIQISNKGNSDAYGIRATLIYPSAVKLVSYKTKSITETDTYIFNVDTLKAGEIINFQLIDSVSLETSVGERLPIEIQLEAEGGEINPDDNTTLDTILIVGPIDPNDIQVNPKGEGPLGYISKEQLLSYKIRFQNVGTYSCSKVVITNQLSEYLDFSTLKIINASHNYQYSLSNSGELSIVFNDIDLPDSTSNEKGSHGFVEYTISTSNSLVGAESIYNSALIAFDFEDAVKTNRVLNTIRLKSEEKTFMLNASPNPTSGIVNLSINNEFYKFENPPAFNQIFVFDAYGNLIHSQLSENEYNESVELSRYKKGTYFIRVIDNFGNLHLGKVILF